MSDEQRKDEEAEVEAHTRHAVNDEPAEDERPRTRSRRTCGSPARATSRILSALRKGPALRRAFFVVLDSRPELWKISDPGVV